MFIAFFFFSAILQAQIWEKTFSYYSNVYPREIKEHYDKGFILNAGIAMGGLIKIGWILKLDINGNILWEKKIGDGSNFFYINGIDTTMDGGIIFTGVTDTINDDQWDPYIVKMNSCAEVEWCRIFQTDTKTDFGNKVRALQDNTCTMLVYDWKEDMSIGMFFAFSSSVGISVVKIDTLGTILNEKILDHSLFIPVDAMFTSDQMYLVTAMDEENNK